ncbi:hypothetical protein ACFQL7_21030 [Halocatena marina]|uniref:Transcriptional regulator n=1 Tax=Halocatena marina TaxID=2934937 RepID=A0ABD5YS00_9EURY
MSGVGGDMLCDVCDGDATLVREEPWAERPDGVIQHYRCGDEDCENVEGRVYIRADGSVFREEGVW